MANGLIEPNPGRDWPSEELYEVLALAQHHGLPTRLLDWTRRAHIAAYFAAAGVVQCEFAGGPRLEGDLAIWELDRDQLDLYDKDWTVIRVPGRTSRNLAAQEGEFTLRRPLLPHHKLSELALDQFFTGKEESPLRKITAPKSLAAHIIRCCQSYGVSGVNLFPDYYGAVRATLDKYSGG